MTGRARVPARAFWFDAPAQRIRFAHDLRELEALTIPRRTRYPGGFDVAVTLRLPDMPPRRVTIAFHRATPASPRVFADGPTDSPHRYGDGSLCMWHPDDPEDRRWVPQQGAAALVAEIAAHLIREEWWRRTGEWAGDEVTHTPFRPTNESAPR
ncbi:hypothetical protein [uncultured Amnibacterium sp.]|uniref:hypothetical protein n=1 Tax=uncultured Amnibacterium sp. TaxID=1631851 RepID=UPI0035CA06C2